jgi:hypothetical protein
MPDYDIEKAAEAIHAELRPVIAKHIMAHRTTASLNQMRVAITSAIATLLSEAYSTTHLRRLTDREHAALTCAIIQACQKWEQSNPRTDAN